MQQKVGCIKALTVFAVVVRLLIFFQQCFASRYSRNTALVGGFYHSGW